MPIRFKTVVVVLVASLLVLFGGWFAYKQFKVEQPLRDQISSLEHVKLHSLDMNRDVITIDVTLNDVSDLEKTFRSIYDAAESVNNRHKDINILIKDSRNDVLETVWEDAQFTVFEGVETHAYSIIPAYFDQLEDTMPEVKSDVKIDDQFVYVTIKNGSNELYNVVPRSINTEEGNE